MINKILERDVYLALKKALDAASLRHQVIANNIANVDTPGYKRADVTFEEELKFALERKETLQLRTTHENHISSHPKDLKAVQAKVIRRGDEMMRTDLSNVDIEREMANLTQNNIAYNALAELIAGKIRSIKRVIQEGRG